MSSIAETAKIYPNVIIEDGAEVGEFCIVGLPAKGKASGEVETRIGKDAVIRSHTVIYAGNMIGDDFNSGHAALIREDNHIGNNVSIGSHTVIEHHVDIQDGVRIHSQAFVPEYTTLENGCWIGPNVVFTNAMHPLCKHVKECLKGATVKSGAKIGANSTILPDITIGKMALIGAGSVVVKDVPDKVVVGGSPAKKIKDVADLSCAYGICDRPYEI